MDKLRHIFDSIYWVTKAPPGPPPRKGLEWKEETHRWIRPKDESVTSESPRQLMYPNQVQALERVQSFLQSNDTPVYLFGGVIRDMIMGKQPKDLDFRVGGDYQEFVQEFIDYLGDDFVGVHRDLMISEVHINTDDGPISLDFVPFDNDTIERDLETRDFTINSMAISAENALSDDWRDKVLDPTGGIQDLKDGIIRPLRSDSMSDDPIRILRAFRFSLQLGFEIDDSVYASMVENAPRLRNESGRRIRNETMKMLSSPNAASAVRTMKDIGILDAILPELVNGAGMDQPPNRHYYDVLDHQIYALDAVQKLLNENIPTNFVEDAKAYFGEEVGEGYTRADLMNLSALLHDIGKVDTYGTHPETGNITFYEHEIAGADMLWDISDRWSFDKKSRRFLDAVSRNHMRPWTMAQEGEMPSSKAIRNFVNKTGDAAPAVLLLHLSDLLSSRGPNLSDEEWNNRVEFVDTVWSVMNEQKDRSEAPRLLTGHDLIDMGIPQGPDMGRLLGIVNDAQIRGDITTREEAVELIQRNKMNVSGVLLQVRSMMR